MNIYAGLEVNEVMTLGDMAAIKQETGKEVSDLELQSPDEIIGVIKALVLSCGKTKGDIDAMVRAIPFTEMADVANAIIKIMSPKKEIETEAAKGQSSGKIGIDEIYFLFSHEFGWTPDTIDKLTFDRALIYIEQINKRRKDIRHSEVTLTEIKSALWAFFGVKEESLENQLKEIEKAGLPVNAVEKDVFDAWVKAGMPSPPEKFFREYKNNG